MFLDLFYGLRDEGVPVALQEWMTLLEAVKRGMHGSSLLRFYHLSRACLVKSETYFDAYDRVFARVFHGVEGAFDVTDDVLKWLQDPKNFPNLSPEELAALERLSSDELMRSPSRTSATTAATAGSAPADARRTVTAANTPPAFASATRGAAVRP